MELDRLAWQAAQVTRLQFEYLALPVVLLNWFLQNAKMSFYCSIDYGLIFCLPLLILLLKWNGTLTLYIKEVSEQTTLNLLKLSFACE